MGDIRDDTETRAGEVRRDGLNVQIVPPGREHFSFSPFHFPTTDTLVACRSADGKVEASWLVDADKVRAKLEAFQLGYRVWRPRGRLLGWVPMDVLEAMELATRLKYDDFLTYYSNASQS